MRKAFLVGAMAVVIIGALEQRATAQPISRHNPYRAFNHTGVNYGAQQWERRYGASRSSSGQGYVRSGGASSSIVGTPSNRWSYSSAYRGGSVATPVAPNCR